MRSTLFGVLLTVFFIGISCDVQSGMSKKGVEKFLPTSTPEIKATLTPEPIDPKDSIVINTETSGDDIMLDDPSPNKSVNCGKYERVMLNAMDAKISIKGGCRQLMVNGNRNTIKMEGTTELIFNGNDNKVVHTKFINQKRPEIKDNGLQNMVEKTSAISGK